MSAQARASRQHSVRGGRPRWLLSLTAAGVLLIIGAIALSLRGKDEGTRTAFASAPTGAYAVVVFPSDEVDTISAVSAATGDVFELARVPHLPGYTSFAAVSPDGRHVAIVAADSGVLAAPVGSLLLLNVETGSLVRLVEAIDQLQQPAWSPDSQAILVTRTTPREEGLASVSTIRATIDGASATIGELRASGAYPVGYDAAGRLLVVAIDGDGSSLFADFAKLTVLGPGVTRDWELSPDGTQLAYIEADTSSGLRYLPRVIDLSGEKGAIAAQALGAEQQALGATWQPGGAPLFGTEPAPGAAAESTGDRSTSAQTLAGFDVPLGFTGDGSWLAIQHWSGESFAAPGSPEIQLISRSGMRGLPGATRFYGWASR